jgi:MFS family permease
VKLYAVQHLGLTETQFGLAVAPVAAAMGICAVPMGRLGDKYGRCVAVCWGLFGSAIALWVLALFRNIIFDALAGVVIGLGFTLAFPAWMALIASSTTASRRGEVIGAVGAAQGLAAIVGAALGALVYSSDRLSFPRLGVVNYNVPFWWSAILMSVGTVLAFTWMCCRNSARDTGDGIRPGQRKLVIVSAVVGLIVLVLWIGWRYTQPVAPERVAWSWVQELYRGRPDKATKYTLPAAAGGWNGPEASRSTSRTLVRYKKKLGALWYTVFAPRTISNDRVEVPVKFVLHNLKDSKWVQIAVCKPPSSREWKVCGIRYGE